MKKTRYMLYIFTTIFFLLPLKAFSKTETSCIAWGYSCNTEYPAENPHYCATSCCYGTYYEGNWGWFCGYPPASLLS